MSEKSKSGCGCWTLMFMFIAVAILGKIAPQDDEHPKLSADPTTASAPYRTVEKLEGMTKADAFEYGRLTAHALFNEASERVKKTLTDGSVSVFQSNRAKAGMNKLGFGNYIQEIRSAFPPELPSDDVTTLSREARFKGLNEEVVSAYANGFRDGAHEVRNGF